MEESILTFWFGPDVESVSQERARRWFSSNPANDREIAQRFGKLYKAAAKGAFREWCTRPRGRLALVILLDQFSRNLNRESPLAWAQDAVCQELAIEGVELGQDMALAPAETIFLYMPFQHSEIREHQDRSVELYQALSERYPTSKLVRGSLESAEYHRELVVKFGRFPHRNRILGRETTADEQAYLDGLPKGKPF